MRRAGLCGKWKGPGADSEEKHEPVSDIDIAVAVSLKVLDLDGRLEKQTSRAPGDIRSGQAGDDCLRRPVCLRGVAPVIRLIS